jgi:hypothetical protein
MTIEAIKGKLRKNGVLSRINDALSGWENPDSEGSKGLDHLNRDVKENGGERMMVWDGTTYKISADGGSGVKADEIK